MRGSDSFGNFIIIYFKNKNKKRANTTIKDIVIIMIILMQISTQIFSMGMKLIQLQLTWDIKWENSK